MPGSYINSNYRFVVNPHGDFRAQSVDPDVHLSWDVILQILASARTQCPNCPICLSTPVAPRMSKCGHIFCLPCLLRYMASDDGNNPNNSAEKKPRYKKCVICTDSVYVKDIKPVRFFTGQQNDPPKDGEGVILRLVTRKPGNTLALPIDGAGPSFETDQIPWHFASEVMDYARIMKGTGDYMTEQFDREIQELVQLQEEDELMFGEQGDWPRKAVGLIRIQMEGLAGMGNAPQSVLPPKESKEKEKEKERRPPIQFLENPDDVPEMYHVQHESRSGHASQSHTPIQLDDSSSINSQPVTDAIPSSSAVELRVAIDTSHDSLYFFYQALLHYYLSPLDIRILKAAFGAFASFPSTVSPRVENVSTGHSVDDNLRKRARYLAHLPYGCEVGFLECDWTNIVPGEILEKYKPDIEKRRKKKRDKEIKEERDRARAEKLEDEERWATARQRNRETYSELDIRGDPHIWLDNPEPAAETEANSSGSAQAVPSTSRGSSNESSAFATTSPSPSPSQRRTVWGTPAITSAAEPAPVRKPDITGWLTDDLLMEEDMLAQIEQEESMADDAGGRAPNHGKGQKKKKFKKVTLMSNGGKRGA
jgi:hypothetical protein